MVASYTAGFVVFFAVASVIYQASTRWPAKSRTRISATRLAHASPVGLSSARLIDDLMLENFALRQQLLVLRDRPAKPRLETPEKLFGCRPEGSGPTGSA